MRVLITGPLAIVLFVATSSCSQSSSSRDCPGTCPANQAAVFHLTCGPSDLAKVTLTGVCAAGDGNPATYFFGATDASLAIHSTAPGSCHVAMNFTSGFTYSADVSFTQQTTGSSGCSCTYTEPTTSTFAVGNPSNTCLDASAGAD